MLCDAIEFDENIKSSRLMIVEDGSKRLTSER